MKITVLIKIKITEDDFDSKEQEILFSETKKEDQDIWLKEKVLYKLLNEFNKNELLDNMIIE